MFHSIEKKFKNLLNRFTYRQRFIFWVLIVFLVAPLPAYWILNTQHSFSSHANLQLRGSQEARLWLQVFDGVVNNYIQWTCRIASGEEDRNELLTLERTIHEVLERLRERLRFGDEEIIVKKGFFYEITSLKSNKGDVEFLEKIWAEISHHSETKDIKDHEILYQQILIKLSQKIQEVAYTFHLILHLDKTMQQLSQTIYFSFIEDQILLTKLSEIISHFKSSEESKLEIVDQAKYSLNNLKDQFRRTKYNLEVTYQDLKNKSFPVWKEFSYQEATEEAANCYLLNTRLIERTLANLATVENEDKTWPGSNSLFIKNADCIQKNRNIANTVFEEMLLKEKHFYLWQQAIIIFALSFFVFLMFTFIIFRFLSSHFKQMHSYIQGLAKGHFSNQMNINPNEEMGQIAIAFQKMGKSIEEVVEQLKMLGIELSESNEKIGKTTQKQSGAVVVQRKCLSNLDRNINKISENSRELADTMDAFTQISKDRLKKDLSDKGLQHLQNKMAILKNGSLDILEILSGVHEKGSNAHNLTTHMTKISDQASLLALNAAIESLNVKGVESFDDITEKIQLFSKKTSASTLEIQKIVNEMSQSVALGKITAESCIKQITRGASRLIEVSTQLQTITGQDVFQNEQFHLVNTMMHRQAERSEEIIQFVRDLGLINNENTQFVEMLYQTIQQLGIAAQELHIVVNTLFSEGIEK